MIIISVIYLLIGALKSIADAIQAEPSYRTTEWTNKYKLDDNGEPLEHGNRKYSKARRIYNKIFVVKYQERFLFSTTILVSATDAWHQANWQIHFLSIMGIITIYYSKLEMAPILFTTSISYLVGFHTLNYICKE